MKERCFMFEKLKDYFDLHLPEDAQGKDKLFFALNVLIPVLMALYVFVNPLPLNSVNEVCYYLSCAALVTLLLFRKTPFTLRSPLTIGLLLFFAWAVLGLFITLDFSNTLHDLRGYLLEYLIIFYLLINFYNSSKRLEFLSDLVIASAMVFSIGGLIIFYGIEGNPFSTRFGETFVKMYTGFMCFTTIFAGTLSLRGVYQPGSMLRQSVYFFCFLVLTMVTMLNKSRGATISLCVALLIMCLHRKKNIILIAVAGAMIAFTPGFIDRINTMGFTQDPRSKMFRLSVEVIKDHPIAGVGYGGEIYRNSHLVDLEKYDAGLPEKYQQKKDIVKSTHNTFLDVAIRTGLVGLALFCLIVLTAVWMLWDIFRRRKEEFFRSWSICLFACLASIMIIYFFADALYGAQGIILYIVLAMISILWNLARKDHTVPSGVKT
jgi:O-antigen ligase